MEDHIVMKVVCSGDVVEVIKYRMPVKCGFDRAPVIRSDDDVNDRRFDNLKRAQATVRRLVWCNYTQYSKFLTLTYKDTVLDVKRVRRDITTFVQSMKRKGYPLEYLYVLEHQKERGLKEGNEGCLHAHMIVFGDRYIPLEILKSCWKHGIIDIHKLKDVNNVGAYVCKYITKEDLADFGAHAYACSKGLKRPIEDCYYASGYSDKLGQQSVFSSVLDDMDVRYHGVSSFDIASKSGFEPFLISQTVDYYQGTFKFGSDTALKYQLSDIQDRAQTR